ncbi:hypothetical protein EJB05_37076 [Eragrostis curvula]|uniref:Ubiquitin-like protease family profile domain-containing protein n=1 Tax=Eragrostis curvula TaxID=38414 RepID=A0A5J9TQJ2_9POAL|nr:hypothetical protein EJB05_37076 [Eragrostis curvula]
MARKRGPHLIELTSSDESEDNDLNNGISDADLYGHAADGAVNSDDDMSDGVEVSLLALHNCMKEINKIKLLKNKMVKKLKKSMEKRQRIEREPKEIFTRFSVTSFSNVISALNYDQKKVLQNYGFGSLLTFDKCYVPSKFVKWVAHSVDHKSGDIILDGKVISLTRESLHMVLELPMGSKPFPINTEAGKSRVFCLFGLSSMPLTSFFADKILKHEDMSEEQLVICFVLVAMSSFLCPNTCLKPSQNYFGVFEDIDKFFEYDWCGYIIDWLLNKIKTFNMGKQITANELGNSLGGCLYYLAVIYLDNVDFGNRQPPDTIPRVLVWKQDMIKSYSDLDEKSHGVYGLRPLLDRSVTCYAKTLLKPRSLSLSNDSDFLDSLDIVFGCNLPNFLKMNICKLIESYSLNSALSIDLDLTALNPLPVQLKRIFSKLLNHISSVEDRAKNLVLDLLKLLNDSSNSSEKWHDLQKNSVNEDNNTIPDNGEGDKESPVLGNIAPPDHASDDIQGCASQLIPELPVPNLTNAAITSTLAKSPNVDLQKVLRKLSKHSTSTANEATAHAPSELKSQPSMVPLRCNAESAFKNQTARKPFKDISNACNNEKSASFKDSGCSRRDVIYIDGDVEFVPDSLSPNPPSLQRRMFVPKVTPGSDRFTPMLHQRTPIHMQNLDSSPDMAQKSNIEPNVVTPDVSILKESIPSKYRLSKLSPEIQFLGERSIFDKVQESTRKSELQYNEKFHYSQGCSNTKKIPASRINLDSLGSRPFPRVSEDQLQYDREVHSSGGKENLLLDPEQANNAVLERGFSICSKTRPLSKSNLLFFPTCYDNHWFVFAVDIEDKNFVFLDPFYSKDDAFQEHVRDRMIYSFMIQWDRYVGVDMKFDEYDVVYPNVPAHSEDNMCDSGIISMICVEYWTSPRVMLSTIFSTSDVPNIRVKIANNLLFNSRNKGNKNLVIAYMDEGYLIFSVLFYFGKF